MDSIFKYPRTRHIEGSRFQEGDEDLESVPYSRLAGQFVVIEEKLDGANSGFSFDEDGQLRLQSRGHYLVGGGRERHFDLFKTWAQTHQRAFWERLGSRYLVYGEWLYAKHTIFYDRLPHYFLEFDVLDRESSRFLSTRERHRLLTGLPICSVPVLWQGQAGASNRLAELVAPSLYKSPQWNQNLLAQARNEGLNQERVVRETDDSPLAEGLYLKVETATEVIARYKWVRASFLTRVRDSESHWQSRPLLPNQLAPEVDLFRS